MNDHTETAAISSKVIPFASLKSTSQSVPTESALIVAPVGALRERLARIVGGESLQLLPVYLESTHLQNGNGLPSHDPRLIAVDFSCDGLRSTIECVRGLHRDYPNAVIVAITNDCGETMIDDALDAGVTSVACDQYADEYLAMILKLAVGNVGHRPVVRSVKQNTMPEVPKFLEPNAGATIEQIHAAKDPMSRLSEKQLEVLSLMTDGLTNAQIGQRLKVKVGTVKTHVTQILRRLGVDRRAEAILKAQRMHQVREQQVAFARTGEGLLGLLLPHVTYARHHKGDVIFRLGDQARHMYYIKRGSVRMVDIEKTCGPGEIFGEIGMFVAGGIRTSTAVCETDVELFFMTEAQVQEMLYVNPQFAIHVAATMATRLLADRAKNFSQIGRQKL